MADPPVQCTPYRANRNILVFWADTTTLSEPTRGRQPTQEIVWVTLRNRHVIEGSFLPGRTDTEKDLA